MSSPAIAYDLKGAEINKIESPNALGPGPPVSVALLVDRMELTPGGTYEKVRTERLHLFFANFDSAISSLQQAQDLLQSQRNQILGEDDPGTQEGN